MSEVLEELAPKPDDEISNDAEYNPAVEPEKADAWLNMLKESEKAFEEYNDACDNIERLYANLAQLRSQTRDRQFNLFWANLEILKPSIYAKAPVPVVVPKFKDRRPLYQTASELLERCSVVAFDLTRINDLLMLVRDDLATNGRGVCWCRYEPPEGEPDKDSDDTEEGESEGPADDAKPEYVCVDYKDRRDFLHSLSKNWREVSWVAAASYMTKPQAEARFKKFSGDEYQKAEYKVDKDLQDLGGADNRERAKFWEIWHKGMDLVVWVAEGCEFVLDKADPDELCKLSNFFPCPKPAYSAVQPGSLIPVPDVLQYKDQLDEVNTLTGRLHALSQALEVKGFYPAGSAEIGDAVQAAIKTHSPGRVLVPISNWAAFGGSKEVIIWMPIDMIAQTITSVIAVRKQIIDDIYQIMGLSDIMRGATDPNETLGAQQLKSQYGSVRIRDKQGEMVRLARDVEEITAEIMCSEFDFSTMLQMSQMEIPTQQQQGQKIMLMSQELMQMQQQAMMMMQQAQAPPAPPGAPPGVPGAPPGAPGAEGPQAAAQANPDQLVQLQQQAMVLKTNIEDEQNKPTVEMVEAFIKDYRTTAFVLDIETDSTIQPDENAEKQRRGEFMGMMAQLLPQLAALVAQEPGSSEFAGELLKFAVAPFRVGRSLDGSIDNLVEQIEMRSAERMGKGDPKLEADKQKMQTQADIEMKKLEAKTAESQQQMQLKFMELQNDSRMQMQQMQNEFRIAMAEMERSRQENAAKVMQINAQTRQSEQQHVQKIIEGNQKMTLATQSAQQDQVDRQARRDDMAQRQSMQQRNQAFKEQQALRKPFGGVLGG